MKIENLYKEIGQNIKKIRQTKKLSQAEVAIKLGLERTSVTNIENGKQRITLHSLYELCDLLGADIFKVIPSNRKTEKKIYNVTDGENTLQVDEDSFSIINKYVPNYDPKNLSQ